MRGWRAVALAVLCAGFALSAARAAQAGHAPAGAGGCSSHTVTCYPDCRWEWTGDRGSVADPPVDAGYCAVGPEYVGGQPVQEQAPVSSLAVSNLPATYEVGNWPSALVGGRVPVSAVCEDGVPCVANGNAEQVEVVNPIDRPVNATVGAASIESWYVLAGMLALAVGVAVGRVVFPNAD